MVINHLDKLFVTNAAATIVNELEKIGDGANLTISFAGGLLEKAEELVRMGCIQVRSSLATPRPSIRLLTLLIELALYCYLFMLIEILEDLVEKGSENMDVRNKEEVVLRIRSTVAIKKFRPGGYIACKQVCPKILLTSSLQR
uniref:Uncharacterized protein n=1 Tax=Oryza meridionalis TaxID=40149 RepID=A0A0E0F6X6_9ORYZ